MSEIKLEPFFGHVGHGKIRCFTIDGRMDSVGTPGNYLFEVEGLELKINVKIQEIKELFEKGPSETLVAAYNRLKNDQRALEQAMKNLELARKVDELAKMEIVCVHELCRKFLSTGVLE